MQLPTKLSSTSNNAKEDASSISPSKVEGAGEEYDSHHLLLKAKYMTHPLVFLIT